MTADSPPERVTLYQTTSGQLVSWSDNWTKLGANESSSVGVVYIRETPLTKAAGEMLEFIERYVTSGVDHAEAKRLIAKAKGEQGDGEGEQQTR